MHSNDGKIEILGIIPARGGSKTVPKKNIRLLGGKPLLHYVLSQAIQSSLLTDVVVSSDDEEILSVARGIAGESVTMLRPAELAQDDTPDVPVLQHVLTSREESTGKRYDHVVMLHATTPFILAEDIDECIKKLIDSDFDSVVSAYKVTDANPIKMKKIVDGLLVPYVDGMEERGYNRRQDLPDVYRRNAGIYASKRSVVMGEGRVWGDRVVAHIMPEERSLDINSHLDFLFAEALLEELKKKHDCYR